MTERPILFSGPMVRAIIECRKTQTRRVVKPQPHDDFMFDDVHGAIFHPHDNSDDGSPIWCPYGAEGDRLWVRENGWERPDRTPRMMREGADTWARYYYDADGEDGEQLREWGFKRRPSIHMPRWACRLVLEVTDVRVERLQDISLSDIEAEGYPWASQPADGPYLKWFRELWDSINAKRAPWASNPWVWVVEFRNAGDSKDSSPLHHRADTEPPAA